MSLPSPLLSSTVTRDPDPAVRTAGTARTPQDAERQHGKRHGVWLWPTLVTLAVVTYRIDRPLLWGDELTSWDVASRSAAQLLGTVQRVDAVLAAYYLLLHAWMGVFGDSAMALRLPSALAMAGAAACVALIGQRLFGRRAGLAAGLLFALIPAVSRYGQEARPYAMVVCAVALATLLLLRALDRPGSRWRWAGYALSLAVVGLLHLVALTVVVGHLAAVATRACGKRRTLLRFAVAVLAATACATPVLLMGRAQSGRQISWIPKPDGWGLLTLWPQLYVSALVAGAVMVCAVMAWQMNRGAAWFATATAVLPPLVLWIVSHGDLSYFYPRYMLFVLPAWAVLAGAALAAAPSAKFTAAAMVVLAVLTLPDHEPIRETGGHSRQAVDYEGAARVIEEHYLRGDAVIYDRAEERMLGVGVHFYLPRELRMRDVFLAESAADRSDLSSADCPVPARCLGNERRVWLVVFGNMPDPLQGLTDAQERALRAQYTVSGTKWLNGLNVSLLTGTHTPPPTR
ncbi:glycosyltransferase family 39 protein [Streptomyces sp. NPDC054847]